VRVLGSLFFSIIQSLPNLWVNFFLSSLVVRFTHYKCGEVGGWSLNLDLFNSILSSYQLNYSYQIFGDELFSVATFYLCFLVMDV
jgi:hypothetical protein